MQAPAAIVSGNHCRRLRPRLLGRAGLKHQQNAALGDLEGDQPRRIDESLESEQIAIKRRRAFEVARIERRFQEPSIAGAPPSSAIASPDAFI